VHSQQLQEKNKDLKSHISPNEKRDGGSIERNLGSTRNYKDGAKDFLIIGSLTKLKVYSQI
jgi:hypothetical protein